MHKSGFDPYRENVATHSRRRYRLIPHRGEELRTYDSSLWIVHYSRAAHQDHVQGHKDLLASQNSVLQQRKFWSHQQLIRKEFMLHDRSNWPSINLPPGHVSRYVPQAMGYPGNVISHMNRSQQQKYMQQQQQASGQKAIIGPPANKRMRMDLNAPVHPGQRQPVPHPSAGVAHDIPIDDEEERGDLMDYLTPRDISTVRYMQHHEWMEEIFNSPYSTSQIVPIELGLGRKGELEALTRGFFHAPTSTTPTIPPSGDQPPRVGRLEAGKAEDFSRKAAETVAEIHAEMDRMKRQHAKRMAKLSKSATIRDAERALRSAPIDPVESGTTNLNLHSTRSSATGDTPGSRPQKGVNSIAAEVEALLGKSVLPIKEAECIQKGGLEDKLENTESDIQEDDLVGQLTTMNGQPDQSQDVLMEQDLVGSVIQPPQRETHGVEAPKSSNLYMDKDVSMAEISDASSEFKDLDAGDWVMVNKNNDSAGVSITEDLPLLGILPDILNDSEAQGNGLDTPGDTLQGFTPNAQGNTGEEFGANEFSEAIDFGNLDTAGEALSGYGEDSQSLGLDEHGTLGLDDSAFADGFNPSPQRENEESGL